MLILKAVMPSLVLTMVVSAVLASTGATAGFLNIQDTAISGHVFQWSWPLFLVGSALSWSLLLMMD